MAKSRLILEINENHQLTDDRAMHVPSFKKVLKSDDLDYRYLVAIALIYDYLSIFYRMELSDRKAKVFSILFAKSDNPPHWPETSPRGPAKLIEAAIDDYGKIQYDPLVNQYDVYKTMHKTLVDDFSDSKDNMKNLDGLEIQRKMANIERLETNLERVEEKMLKRMNIIRETRGKQSENWLSEAMRNGLLDTLYA